MAVQLTVHKSMTFRKCMKKTRQRVLPKEWKTKGTKERLREQRTNLLKRPRQLLRKRIMTMP